MERYFLSGRQTKEGRRVKYRIARLVGVNVEESRRIRNWSTPRWELFIKEVEGEKTKK